MNEKKEDILNNDDKFGDFHIQNTLSYNNNEGTISAINKLIVEIHKFDPIYKKLYEILFKSDEIFIDLKNDLIFDIDKIRKLRNNGNTLLEIHNKLLQFLQVLKIYDIVWLEEIKDKILKNLENNNLRWGLGAFGILYDLNKDISVILYEICYVFEKDIKNKTLKMIIQKNYMIKNFSNNKSSTELNLFLKNNPNFLKKEEERYKYHTFFNVINFSDFVDLIRSIEDNEILGNIFRAIFGEYKYMKFLKIYNHVSDFKIKVIDNLNVIIQMRNAIMHFKFLLPSDDENLLMDVLKSFNFFSWQNLGNEIRLGDDIYKKIVFLISSFNKRVFTPKLHEYLSKNFLNYELIDFKI